MASSTQRASMMMKGGRKQVFDAGYIADWFNAFFPSHSIIPDDVLKPECETVCDIYMVMTQHILSLSSATFTMPPFDVNGDVDGEMFTQAMPKLVLHKALKACMEDLTGDSTVFTLNDMLNPTPRNTRRILSILIDFIQFKERMSNEVDEVFSGHEERKSRLRKRQLAVEELEDETDLRRSEQERMKRDENEKRAELEQLCHKVQELVQDNAQLLDKYESGVQKLKSKEKRIEEMESDLKGQASQNKMTHGRVVTSPDKLEAEVKDADQRRENALRDLDSKRRELNAEQDKQRQWAATNHLVETLEESLQEIASYEDTILSAQKKFVERKRVWSKVQERLNDQKRVVSKEQEAANEREAAFEREREKHLGVLRNLREQITTVKSQANEMRRRLADGNKENAEIQREVCKLKDELSAVNRKAEAEDKMMANRLRGVLSKLNEARRVYNEEMSAFEEACSMVKQAMQLDAQEHSDTIPIATQRRSTVLTDKNNQ